MRRAVSAAFAVTGSCAVAVALLAGFAQPVMAGVVTIGTLPGFIAQALLVASLPITAPTDGQALTYVSSTGRLTWATIASGSGDLTEIQETGDALVIASGTGPVPSISAHARVEDEADGLDSSAIAALSSVTNIEPTSGHLRTVTISASMAGDAEFSVATTNLSNSVSYRVHVIVTVDGGGPYTPAFDSDMVWHGTKPTSLTASTVYDLYLTTTTTAQTGVVCEMVARGNGS